MAYATVEELGRALRMSVNDTNTDALQACLDAAAEEIDHEVDWLDPAADHGEDALLNRVNLLRAVEWWKSNDAAFGVIGFDQAGALQAPRDGFNRHAYALTPRKEQWGIA
jgi:hypothetical protein